MTAAFGGVAPGPVPSGSFVLLLTMSAAAVGVAGGVLAEVASRLSATPRASRLAACLWIYSLVVLPTTSGLLGPVGAADLAVIRVVTLLGAVAVLVGFRPVPADTRRTGRVAAGLIGLLLVLTDLAARAWPSAALRVLADPAPELVVLAVWSIVAVTHVVAGVRTRSRAAACVGGGLAVLLLGHTCAAAGGGGGNALLLHAGPVVRLVGLLIITAGALLHALRAERAHESHRRVLERELSRAAAIRLRSVAAAERRDHALRTGLLGLSALTERLPRSAPAAERERLRDVVQGELDRLEAVLEGAEGSDGQFGLNALVEEVVTPLREQQGVRADIDVRADLWVSGRRTVVRQVLAEVVTNRVHRTPGASLRIDAERRGDRVRLRIRGAASDDHALGPGIAVSQQLLASEGASITVEGAAPSGQFRILVVLTAASEPAVFRDEVA